MAKPAEDIARDATVWVVLFTVFREGKIEEQVWGYAKEDDARSRLADIERFYDTHMKDIPLLGLRLYGLNINTEAPEMEVTLH